MVTAHVVDVTRQAHRILLPVEEPEHDTDYEHAAVMPGGKDKTIAIPLLGLLP